MRKRLPSFVPSESEVEYQSKLREQRAKKRNKVITGCWLFAMTIVIGCWIRHLDWETLQGLANTMLSCIVLFSVYACFRSNEDLGTEIKQLAQLVLLGVAIGPVIVLAVFLYLGLLKLLEDGTGIGCGWWMFLLSPPGLCLILYPFILLGQGIERWLKHKAIA